MKWEVKQCLQMDIPFCLSLFILKMASAAVPEEVAERLSCAVCMEQFREPKVLPCLHTYCNACLEKLVKKKDMIIL